MIAGDLLLQVPGCEGGDPPYSQELIGGGRVNRSFLVRTRRGRFVVRLNDNSASDPGLDRDRELALHSAAAAAGIAPPVVYAAPDRSCLVTEFVDGRVWTPHYFSRMRDLRSLGQRLRALHAIAPPPLARFDPLSTARRYADTILRHDPNEAGRINMLLANGVEALARSGGGKRAPCIVHGDLHHGNVLTADRVYFIDWEYAQVGDPLHDLACVLSYYPRAAPHSGRGPSSSRIAASSVDLPMPGTPATASERLRPTASPSRASSRWRPRESTTAPPSRLGGPYNARRTHVPSGANRGSTRAGSRATVGHRPVATDPPHSPSRRSIASPYAVRRRAATRAIATYTTPSTVRCTRPRPSASQGEGS